MLKKFFVWLFLIGVFVIAVWGLIWAIQKFYELIEASDPSYRAAIIAGVITVIGSTLAVVIGRYMERRKEIESHFRQSKIEIYDEFLKEFFSTFYQEEKDKLPSDEKAMVDFLREWQRKIILWGGQDVLSAYVKWMDDLKKGNPTVNTIFLMEEFFKAIRSDVGHRNWKIPKGTYSRFILKNADLMLEEAKRNPKMTLSELSDLEESARRR